MRLTAFRYIETIAFAAYDGDGKLVDHIIADGEVNPPLDLPSEYAPHNEDDHASPVAYVDIAGDTAVLVVEDLSEYPFPETVEVANRRCEAFFLPETVIAFIVRNENMNLLAQAWTPTHIDFGDLDCDDDEDAPTHATAFYPRLTVTDIHHENGCAKFAMGGAAVNVEIPWNPALNVHGLSDGTFHAVGLVTESPVVEVS